MLFIQTVAFSAALVAIAIAVPAPGSSQSSLRDDLFAIHTVTHHQRSELLNLSRSAPAATSQTSMRFLAAARPPKTELIEGAPVIFSHGKKATRLLSTPVSFTNTFTAMVRRVQPEFTGAYSSKVSKAATGEDEERFRSLSTEAREIRRDSGAVRARRESELAQSLTRLKLDVAGKEQVDSPRDGQDLSGPVSRAGLTFDPCLTSLDCAGVRVCSLYGNGIENCNGRTDCVCLPILFQKCASSVDCVAGETCVPDSDSSLSFCISSSFVASTEAPGVTGGPSGSEGGSSNNSASTVGDGLSFALCFEDSDCKGSRTCAEEVDLPCDGTATCLCIPERLRRCDSSDFCFAGEVCVLVPDNLGPWCASPVAAEIIAENGGTIITDGSESTSNSDGGTGDKPPPTAPEGQPPPTAPEGQPAPTDSGDKPPSTDSEEQPPGNASEGEPESEPENVIESASEESVEVSEQGQAANPQGDVGLNIEPEDDSSDEGVCVDARALAHMPTFDLVFERHPRARVLCDAQSSCATPGHMVVFRGEAMMMKSYCRLTSCSKRVMEVNSPRYRRQLLVSSNTDELKFTAFAARYETRGEEKLMSMAVRMGW